MNPNNMNTTSGAPKKSDGSFGADKSFQEKIMSQIKELGDSIERAGEKVEKKGWETIGQAIYKLGNSLEHLSDKKFSSDSKGSTKAYTDKEFDDKSKKSSDTTASAGKVGGNDSQAY